MIGITCPAGYMEKEKVNECIKTLQSWGYEVMLGKTVGSNSQNYFSGTDEERLNEFQAMLDDDSIEAILCGRGGYGVVRIIDQLNFRRFMKKPKWVIGFSDITVLHSHLLTKTNTASIHGPMANAFNHGGDQDIYVASLKKMLTGKLTIYTCSSNPVNKTGEATGILAGGNLSLLSDLIGSPSEINPKGKILFIEDIGEYLYNIDRMLYQLKRAGYFDVIKGLIIGGFSEMKDTVRPFGKTLQDLILDIIEPYNFPYCFDFPVSHENENLALMIGGNYHLTVTKKKVRLKLI
jgi:muramoyltetrapeptide carboxypeptidase